MTRSEPTPGVVSAIEVLRASLKLGLTSFGGPIAHLGYFERAYVRERGWLSSEEYAGVVALCQLLPGPTSSQVGFLIGLHRAGWRGALAAWAGFTLPSALLMFAFAQYATALRGPGMQGVLHGLMLAAVAVVAQAVWSMARTLCPDRQRAGIAVASAVLLILHSSGLTQVAAMVIGGVGGWLWCRDVRAPTFKLATPIPGAVAARGLALFALLLIALPAAAWLSPRGPVALVAIFYRAGALVFGGGHVVLPLLREALVPTGWISDAAFLAGYGLAQAMPGPLFTFAAYLGAASAPAHAAALSAAIALVAMFLPGLLLAASGRSLLSQFKPSASAYAILAGVNASVVGILGAALYSPVWTSAVRSLSDGIVALIAFALLQGWRIPPIVVVLLCVCASTALRLDH